MQNSRVLYILYYCRRKTLNPTSKWSAKGTKTLMLVRGACASCAGVRVVRRAVKVGRNGLDNTPRFGLDRLLQNECVHAVEASKASMERILTQSSLSQVRRRMQ